MMRFLSAVLVILVSWPAGSLPDPTGALDKTVILVRHAEKAAEPASDPVLSPAGEERAEALARMLRDAGVDHIITSHLARTHLTARHVAAAEDISPEVVPIGGGMEAHLQATVEAIRARPDGETILVVGHSNTIPSLVTRLTGIEIADLADDEYATVFIVHLSRTESPSLIRASYGKCACGSS